MNVIVSDMVIMLVVTNATYVFVTDVIVDERILGAAVKKSWWQKIKDWLF